MDHESPSQAKAYVAAKGPSGLAVAVAFGALVALGGAWFATRLESFGYSFIIGLPVVAGFVIGYYGWTKGAWIPAAVAGAIASALGLALAQNLAGFFCGAVTSLAVLLPMTAGAFVGYQLRKRHYARLGVVLPAALVFLVPVALWAEAELTPRHALATIETSRVLAMDPEAAWGAAAFYEDVAQTRSHLLRISLPAPIGTTGHKDQIGSTVRCLYEGAHITKRMTEVEPGRVLAFEIIEQSGIEDRSVALRRGAFRFEPLAGGRTRVTLSSTYEPLLDARLLWRPIERTVCRELHRHILNGMEAQTQTHERDPSLAIAK